MLVWTRKHIKWGPSSYNFLGMKWQMSRGVMAHIKIKTRNNRDKSVDFLLKEVTE